jgi:hypothetical protein
MIALVAMLLAQPLIDRPLNLPAGTIEGNILVNYSQWSQSGQSLDGEAGALGLEVGITNGVELGLSLSAPLNPQFGIGTLIASGLFAVGQSVSLRGDVGLDHLTNQDLKGSAVDHVDLPFVGFGVPIKAKITGSIAFVSGSAAAFKFGHFTNLGINGFGAYQGAAQYLFSGADLVTFGHFNDVGVSTNFVNFNLPIGLQFQVAEPLAITVSAAYHYLWVTEGTTDGETKWIPIGIEAVFSPSPRFDVGASFSLAGAVGGDTTFDYTAIRNAAVWFRVRSL